MPDRAFHVTHRIDLASRALRSALVLIDDKPDCDCSVCWPIKRALRALSEAEIEAALLVYDCDRAWT